MSRWRNLPIKRKLVLMMLLVSGLTMVLACAGIVIHERQHVRETMEHDLATLAEIIAANSTADLSFDDPKATKETLDSLKDKPHIVSASVFRPDGATFASYLRAGAADHRMMEKRPAGMIEGSRFDHDSLCLYRQIRFSGETLGTVALESDLRELDGRLMESVRIVFVLLAGASLLALLLASRLQRFISEPIQALAETAKEVSATKNYRVRVEADYGRDELGLLVDGFNEMLGQIQQREEALEQRNHELKAENLQRGQSEAALRQSEERYRALVTQSSDAIWRLELEPPVPVSLPPEEQIEWCYRCGTLAECNDVKAQMSGAADPEELVGTPLDKLLRRDDARNIRNLRVFIKAGYRLVDTESFETDGAGRPRNIRNNLIGIVEDDSLVRIWIRQRDVTARRRAEEAARASEIRYRMLFDQIADPIVIFDKVTHYFLDFNASFLRIYGYSATELRAMTPLDLHPPEEVEMVAGIIDQKNTGQPLSFTHLTRAGGRIAVECLASEIEYQGRPAWITIIRDITERKEAEEKLLAFTEQLKRSNRELEDFAFVASHDLQEPLRKVQAFGDRLKAKYGDTLGEQGRDYLGRMQSAAERMQRLINDLLTFSRVTTKAQPFRPTDLGQITRDVLADLEVRLEQTAGRVLVGELPVIDADPLQMRQLLQNLIGNALKFHQPGVPPVIRVDALVIERPERHPPGHLPGRRAADPDRGQWCELSVADNGIGFDEKYLDRIFTIFQRLQGREQYEGTGVGLAVCRKIADRHGGFITAQSQPGRGAKFIVALPVRQSVSANEQQAKAMSRER